MLHAAITCLILFKDAVSVSESIRHKVRWEMKWNGLGRKISWPIWEQFPFNSSGGTEKNNWKPQLRDKCGNLSFSLSGLHS